jgi:hypothetical protein
MSEQTSGSNRKSTKGTKQIGAEVNAELLDEFKAFCAQRGDTLRHHLEMAMRRHLASPPPVVTIPPLPPVGAPAPAAVSEKPTAKKPRAKGKR